MTNTVEKLNIKVTFTEPVLGTTPGDKQLAATHQIEKVSELKAARSPEEAAALKKEELETIPEIEDQIQKSSTIFHADEKGLFCFDYQWRGFFKERIGQMIELGNVKKLNPWNFRKACDGSLFVFPRRVHFTRNGKFITKPDDTLQRPIRALTMRGERIGLANSQLINAGAQCQIEVVLVRSSNQKSAWFELTLELLQSCLDMGKLSGLMQWRSGGYGRFTWEEVKAV